MYLDSNEKGPGTHAKQMLMHDQPAVDALPMPHCIQARMES